MTKRHRANSDHAPTVHADHRVATAQSATFHRNKTMADTNAVLVAHDQKADSNHRETSTAATTTTTRVQARTQLELAALAADSDQEVHQAAAMALEDSEVALVVLVVLALMAALVVVHSDLDLIVAHEIAAVLIKPRERRSLKTHHHYHQTSFFNIFRRYFLEPNKPIRNFSTFLSLLKLLYLS